RGHDFRPPRMHDAELVVQTRQDPPRPAPRHTCQERVRLERWSLPQVRRERRSSGCVMTMKIAEPEEGGDLDLRDEVGYVPGGIACRAVVEVDDRHPVRVEENVPGD